MGVSLIALCREGKDLPPPDLTTIRYPEEGAASLSLMERDHFWFWARRKAILALLRAAGLPGSSPSWGLDVGCGTGFNAAFLTAAGLPTIGIDPRGCFEEVKRSGRAAGLLRGDIFGLEPVPEFDFVLMLDVIEHVEDDRGFVRRALRFLKPGGVALITVPAFPALWSAIDDASGHLRRYTKRSMADLVAAQGGPVSMASQVYFFGATLPFFAFSRTWSQGRAQAAFDAREVAPGRLVNGAFKAALGLESLLLPLGGLPLGSSLFVTLKRG